MIIKGFKTPGGDRIQLRSQVLRNIRPKHAYRQVRRADLAKLFRQPLLDGVRVRSIDGQIEGNPWSRKMWSAIIHGPDLVYIYHQFFISLANCLSIGCIDFSVKQTQQIRDWALKVRKPKKVRK